MGEGWEHPLQPEGESGWDQAQTNFPEAAPEGRPGGRTWGQEAGSYGQQCSPSGSLAISMPRGPQPFCLIASSEL